MAGQLYETFPRDEVDDAMLKAASNLFSKHYGVWGPESERAGKRIRLPPYLLQRHCLPDASSTYTRVTVDGVLVGQALAARWPYGDGGGTVCWVTQLVVHRDWRRQGIATGLLNAVKAGDDEAAIYGVASSHPATCIAAARVFGKTISALPLDFIKSHAAAILSSATAKYIKEATVAGDLFDANDASGLVCGADTGFGVDHAEPERAVEAFEATSGTSWPLGQLPEGHEYLLVFPRGSS